MNRHMENNTLLDQFPGQQQPYSGPLRDLPDAGRILTMGVLSIILFIGIIGFVLAFVTLNRSKEALGQYNSTPGAWTESSLSKVRTGRICAMISLTLFGVMIALIAAS